ncbi:MAG: nucleotidyl transferase AbiEii/AbiGii toxin family protein [Rhodocyclaceae bacterium]|nr:nucleotidyl transferase AbiEii/AbiGii toxin family protein [Rhodocyclaceae bacterium]MDP3032740.1 nucleotidyl transferase AbiEii/AbiGii toxin family protein [Rhodocyclaceae bacterium]
MISKQEIMALAAELQLQAHVVEKDYALGWLLAGIAVHPAIGDRWVFKGGTCLKKCYFETYRFSEDLDFTLQDADHLDEAFLASVFEEVSEWIYDACGLQLPPEARKCEFKGIPVPTYTALTDRPERVAIEVEWEQMLAHQLPVCPPFDEFWQELPAVFDWLNEKAAVPVLAAISSGRTAMDTGWRPPAMVQAWGAQAGSLETIRFAAANRLCVQLDYTKKNGERRTPTIEPYSVRRTSAGDLLLFGVEAETGESKSYLLDRIRSATVTRQAFHPRFAIELTASGPLEALPIERQHGNAAVGNLGFLAAKVRAPS